MFLIGHFLLVSTGQSKSPDWAWNQWDREVQFTQKRASNKHACILNGPLAGYKILGWHCFYHSILKWSFHCLLPSTVDEKFILSLMFFLKQFSFLSSGFKDSFFITALHFHYDWFKFFFPDQYWNDAFFPSNLKTSQLLRFYILLPQYSFWNSF